MSAACPKHDTGGGPCYCPGSAYAEAAGACGTCHHACDCREHKFAVLIKAALDVAVHLDEVMNGIIGVSKSPDDDQIRQDRDGQAVERVYAACEALGVDLGKHEVAA